VATLVQQRAERCGELRRSISVMSTSAPLQSLRRRNTCKATADDQDAPFARRRPVSMASFFLRETILVRTVVMGCVPILEGQRARSG